MKLSALLLLLCLIPCAARALDNCSFNPSSVDDLFSFYKTSCNDQGPLTLCECLKAQASSNALIGSLYADDRSLKVTKDEYVKSETKRLFSMYTQMTYGEAYQRKLLGLQQEPIVGCSPEELSKHYSSAVNEQTKLELNKDKSLVPGSKEFLDKVQRKVDKECNELSALISQELRSRSKEDVSWIVDLKEAKNFYLQKGDKKQAEEIQKTIDEYVKPINYIATPTKNFEVLVNSRPDFSGGGKAMGESVAATFPYSCSVEMGNYKRFMQNYRDDLAVVTSSDKINKNKYQNDSLNGLKIQIDQLNETVAAELKKSYDLVLPHACYTYSQYKIISSKPSDTLLNALLATPEENRQDFFLPNADISNSLELEKRKFLQANPVIANTQNAECARSEITQAFSKYAKETAGKTEDQKMNAYLDLMQGDVIKGLIGATEVKDVAAQNCDFLGRNLAAVMVSDEPGPVPVFNDKNPLGMLEQQVLSCRIREKEASAKTNLKATLNTNPLYLLADENNIGKSDSSSDDDYQKFLTKNCDGYVDFKEKYLSDSGNVQERMKRLVMMGTTAGSEAVREEFLASKASSSDNEVNRVVKAKTKTVLTKEDHQAVKKINAEDSQDKETRVRYARDIKPKMSKSILAERGAEKAFVQEQVKNQQIAGGSMVPSQVAEPEWKSPMPTITPAVLSSAKVEEFLPKSYTNEAPERQVETIQSARENLVTSGQKLIAEAKTDSDKDKIISDLKKSIDKLDEEAAKVEKMASAPPVSVVSPKVAATSAGVSSGSTSGQSTSGSSMGSFSALSGGQTSAATSYSRPRPSTEDLRSKALLSSKYLDAENSQTKVASRSIASETSDSTKIVIGNVLTQEITSDAAIFSHLPLDSTSFGNSELIMSEIKAELAKKNVKPNEKVLIQFFDKTKNIVKVVDVHWANNQWVIREVPRKSMLSNLSLMLIGQTN